MVPYRSVLYMKDQRMIFESRKNVDLMNEDCFFNTPVHFMLPGTGNGIAFYACILQDILKRP
jgi:hypothetical protein